LFSHAVDRSVQSIMADIEESSADRRQQRSRHIRIIPVVRNVRP